MESPVQLIRALSLSNCANKEAAADGFGGGTDAPMAIISAEYSRLPLTTCGRTRRANYFLLSRWLDREVVLHVSMQQGCGGSAQLILNTPLLLFCLLKGRILCKFYFANVFKQ